MFWQLYKYRLKRLLNDKVQLFWIAMFPIVLGTFFYMAFSGISEREETLEKIAVAVVQEGENGIYAGNSDSAAAFRGFLGTLSGKEGILELSEEMDYPKAAGKLADGSLEGIILLGENIRLEFAKNGMNQTILKNLVDRYLQGEQVVKDAAGMALDAAMENIGSVDGKEMAAAETGTMDVEAAVLDVMEQVRKALFEDGNRNENKSISDGEMDPFSQYFFALMAMSCLFGASLGLVNTQEIQADQTKVAVRRLVSPTRKGMAVMTDFLAAFTIQMCCFLLLNLWLQLVLRVNLGNQQGKIILAGAAANLTGIALGYFIGVAVKGKEAVKRAVMLASVLGLSFFSGLMQAGIKYLIDKYIPVFSRINPAALISDCFYHLSVSADMERYAACIFTLFAETAVFGVLSTAILRRERYKSL